MMTFKGFFIASVTIGLAAAQNGTLPCIGGSKRIPNGDCVWESSQPLPAKTVEAIRVVLPLRYPEDGIRPREVLVTITPELLRDYPFCEDWRNVVEVKNFLDNLSKR